MVTFVPEYFDPFKIQLCNAGMINYAKTDSGGIITALLSSILSSIAEVLFTLYI